MLSIDILRIARVKGIDKPYAFLTARGFSHHIARQYTTGNVRRPDLGHVLKLCRLFGCSLQDLFRIDLPKGKAPAANDPLAELSRPAEEPDLHALLRTLPLKDVRQLGRDLDAARKAKPGS